MIGGDGRQMPAHESRIVRVPTKGVDRGRRGETRQQAVAIPATLFYTASDLVEVFNTRLDVPRQ